MEFAARLALVLFIGWASGISLYLTVALIGIGGRAGLFPLGGGLDALAHPAVIATAAVLFVIEFLADKIPFVDSAWDAIHMAVKPLGAFGMGLLAGAGQGAVAQILYGLLTGTLALDIHSMKAASRIAINASPEPFSNIAASLAEQTALIAVFWLCVKHPVAAIAVMALMVTGSFFFLRAVFRLLRAAFFRHSQTSPPSSIRSGF
jgi:hypothetical protein